MEEKEHGNGTGMQTMRPQMDTEKENKTKNVPKQEMQQSILEQKKKDDKREYDRKYHEKNRERLLQQGREYYWKNREKLKQQSIEYRNSHLEEILKRDRARSKECHRRYVEKGRRERPEYIWAQHSITSHRKAGYEMNITKYDLENLAKQTPHCCYCNTELIYGNGEHGSGKKASNQIPTMDRINGDKVITKENVQIICWRCNKTKSNRTHAEFVEYCKTIVTKFTNVENSDIDSILEEYLGLDQKSMEKAWR